MELTLTADLGGNPLSIQTGKVAKQASGAVVVQYGETVVLVSAVSAYETRSGLDFLPLTVEYQEKIYAAGRIPGNYMRREVGRPSEKETLTARLIDRPIRPLFPKGYHSEIQVIATVLSMDQENDPDVLAMIGASAALQISDIPFQGPIAAVRVGRIDGKFVVNPGMSRQSESDINIIVAGSKTGVVMVEGGGNIVSEEEMLDAIFFGHAAMQPVIEIQEKLTEALGKPKRPHEPPPKDQALIEKLDAMTSTRIRESILIPEKTARHTALRELRNQIMADLGEDYADRKGEIYEILHDIERTLCRNLILQEGRRIDGRKFDEIRPITCEVGVLPRPHGSALFTRGETQVLGVLTIGSGQDEQRVETLYGDDPQRFMLHYNFPPFSVGEVKRMGGPSRRDIGHGGLSKRALERILPKPEDFDYTIRIVSEVLESNGSSSMGTVCSGILALMDGGVPITAPVSGIAMGLVKEGDQVVILSDILGDEDHTGDMDFKVAGTRDGITALQMDIKILELSKDVMEKALAQAREGRIFILEKMLQALEAPRKEISPYAPKMITVKINPDKIREIIGPGGKVIRAIQSETNTKIEIDDSGLVKIAATSQQEGDAALQRINEITAEPEVGAVYEGTVVKTMDFGAFVQIFPGTDGLVHISQLARERVKKVTDVVKEGDTLRVKILEINRDGKIRLSHKAVLEEEDGA
ncbi:MULTISPECIES: polyribonucleotide nucleotidyltransferase [Desulfococcus]|uniref:Polyribonucleotide nucleotidyltransferase n=1 Tax=Desulfococcus multivorans DSM 2059 TaxID=1121405 RepID=S7UYB7_DESML|nr:polyribonucleotide nucleotidyltransferase [Desulfococcus multivorans]AOY60309.1 Pnp: polyribonucleotide nucleotidyltransferase (polynucleotide phosphorylase) [Desulfococcus multivorans]AQV02414.1 polyribonucleotide nucleotidyltransferase [Desulfococcus multivorans]EPR39234.1 Polyribonucleotide nucleotidyltransferase [Desulfococcus multivorans DSM 2059]SJZ58488.1 polyribonucleotide nucleotidyltransferase [Desulfococcus multivorans DSM 2059]